MVYDFLRWKFRKNSNGMMSPCKQDVKVGCGSLRELFGGRKVPRFQWGGGGMEIPFFFILQNAPYMSLSYAWSVYIFSMFWTTASGRGSAWHQSSFDGPRTHDQKDTFSLFCACICWSEYTTSHFLDAKLNLGKIFPLQFTCFTPCFFRTRPVFKWTLSR